MDAEANKRFGPIDTDKIDIPFTDASLILDHSFYDVHGSWNYEIDPSSIWSMSFYQSSDDATTRYQYPSVVRPIQCIMLVIHGMPLM